MPLPPTASLSERWQATVAAQPEATAIWCCTSKTTLSFQTLAERANAIKATLPTELRGQTVAFRIPDRVTWLATFIALRQHDCCCLPIDESVAESNLHRLLETTTATALITETELKELSPVRSEYSPHSAALLKLTSGTTGAAKPVPFSESALIADSENVCQTMGIGPTDRNFGLLPLAHSYALGNLVLPLLISGIPLCLGSGQLPSAIEEDLAWCGATVFPSVPQVWHLLTRSNVKTLGQLRLAISAAAPLTPALARTFHDKFSLHLHNFYGSTETGGIAYDRSGQSSLLGRTIGSALDGVLLSIDSEGHLIVESHAVSSAIGTPTRDGRHRIRIADRAAIEPDGQLALLGRVDRVIKYGGRRFDLAELERHLGAALHSEETAIIFCENTGTFTCFVPLGSNASTTKTLQNELPLPTRRTRIVEIPKLPRTPRGKVDLLTLQNLC